MPDESKVLIERLPKEALSFFAFFSRFEYALKRGKYLKGEEGARAEANWEDFAKKLGSLFFDEVKRRRLADAFLAKPPKKQIVVKGDLGWKCVPINSVLSLFEAVRRVRNNLFHGGKFPSPVGVLEDVSRNQQLLKQAQGILEFALEKCPELKEVFWKMD